MFPPGLLTRCILALPLLALSFTQAAERPKLTAEKCSADIVPEPVSAKTSEQLKGRVNTERLLVHSLVHLK